MRYTCLMRSPSSRTPTRRQRALIAPVTAVALALATSSCKTPPNSSSPPAPAPADCVMTFTNPNTVGYDDGTGITVKKMGPVLYLVVGVAWISCVKKPNTLTVDLQLWYKPPGFTGDWREINSNSGNFDISKPQVSGSAMPGTTPVPVPVTAPCVAGDWQIQANVLGENAHGQFILPKVTGPTATLTSTNCHHA